MQREDLTQRRFGQWVVLRFDHYSVHRDAFWLCVCDCGTFKRVPRNRLTVAARRMGGCGHDSRARVADKNRADPATINIFNGKFVAYKSAAKRRQLAFDLSLDQFAELVTKDCHYCGDAPSMLPRNRPPVPNDPKVNGVDRIDSSKGYYLGNVVPCCAICNRMKLDLSSAEFIAKIHQIAKRHS